MSEQLKFHCNNKGRHFSDPGYKPVCETQCAECAEFCPAGQPQEYKWPTAEEFVGQMAKAQAESTPDLPVHATELGFAIRAAEAYAAQEYAALVKEVRELAEEIKRLESPNEARVKALATEMAKATPQTGDPVTHLRLDIYAQRFIPAARVALKYAAFNDSHKTPAPPTKIFAVEYHTHNAYSYRQVIGYFHTEQAAHDSVANDEAIANGAANYGIIEIAVQ
jgi:hypothetical protein